MANRHQRRNGSVDEIDVGILAALGRDAHTTTSDLARSAKMSAPGIAERMRLLEAAFAIAGYSIDRFTPYARTNTSIIQSSPVKRRLPALTSEQSSAS